MQHFPSVLTLDQTTDHVSRIKSHFDEFGFGLWSVQTKSSDEFIGFVGVQYISYDVPFEPTIEVGWRLAHAFWGNGYAPEAAAAAVADVFERIKVPQIVAMTATTNKNSMRVMEKIGMTRDPKDDFDHPKLTPDHPLCRHVLYRLNATLQC